MKINIKGRLSKEEILEQLSSVLNSLEDAGVSDFMGFDLSIDTYSGQKKVTPLINGQKLNVELNDHRNHTCIIPPSPINKVNPSEGIDLGKRALFQGVIELSSNGRVLKKVPKVQRRPIKGVQLSTSDFALNLEGVRRAKVNERLQSKRCLDKLASILGMTHHDLRTRLVSTGWVTTQRGIQNYTSDNIGNKAYRITLNVDGCKDRKVYLFNEEAVLKFESKVTYNEI